jgi:hypothetical protein
MDLVRSEGVGAMSEKADIRIDSRRCWRFPTSTSTSMSGQRREEATMWFRVRGDRHLGKTLGQVRRASGLTQAELARWLDVTRTTVIDMEKGGSAGVRRIVDAFSMLGYDVVIVPRGATVDVGEPAEDSTDPTPNARSSST